MKRLRFLQLLNKYLQGNASAKEARLLEEYYRRLEETSGQNYSLEEEDILYSKMLQNIREKIHDVQQIAPQYHRKRIKSRWWYAAASLMLILSISTGLYLANYKQPAVLATQHQPSKDIVPGGNKALLTLSNGRTIVLDSVHSGQVTSQGTSKVIKVNGAILAYKPGGRIQTPDGSSRVLYNTLATPRGGQYQLILPDGSKVWLNSASSIHYPTVFTGKERRVAITGEAYLEVAEDPGHPFIVTTPKTEIKVLGTHFNVMAYANEPVVKTTLLEGSVKISIPGRDIATIIKPGQQASVYNADRQHIQIKNVNATDIAAWTHGLLSLTDCSIPEFMNQLSRWYDVDIEYAANIPDKQFGGMINRNTHLSDVLAALDAIGIHTRLKDNKIIVLSH